MTGRCSPDTHWGLTYEQLDDSLKETLRLRFPATHARLLDSWRRRGEPKRPEPYRRADPHGFTYVDPSSSDPTLNPNAARRQPKR